MTTTIITITREVEVSDQQCWDVLTTALEGGIGYWSVADHIVRAPDLTVIRVNLAEEQDVDENGVSGATWHTMLAPDVRRGITALAGLIGKEVHPNSEIGRLLEMCLGDDDGFAAADATLADAIVQAALFGEIRYC